MFDIVLNTPIVSLQKQLSRTLLCQKGVLRNFIKFTGTRLCQCLFFNKVAGLRSATLLKKRLWHRRFPANFAKFVRTSLLQNTSGRLLLSLALKSFTQIFSFYQLSARLYFLFGNEYLLTRTTSKSSNWFII